MAQLCADRAGLALIFTAWLIDMFALRSDIASGFNSGRLNSGAGVVSHELSVRENMNFVG